MLNPARAGEAPHGQRSTVAGEESFRGRGQPMCNPGFFCAMATASSVAGCAIMRAAALNPPEL